MADSGIRVGGDVSGTIISGHNNVIIKLQGTEVWPRHGPPPRPVLRHPPEGLPLSRGGPAPIGREAGLRQVGEWLDEGVPAEVTGPPGIGKSLFLRSLAARRSAAGTEVVYLAGAGLSAEDILQDLFEACYDTSGYKPEPARLRRLMGAIRALVIVDDFAGDANDVAALLDATPGSGLVIASTERHLGSQGQVLQLGGLAEEDALAVAERELGRQLDNAERALISELRENAQGHPLALVQAVRAIQAAGSALPGPGALAGALAASLDEQARAVLALLLAAEPASVPQHVVEALTGGGEALARLERAGLSLSQPGGHQAAAPTARLVAEACGLVPDPAAYTQQLASWAAAAPAQQVAGAAPVIVRVLEAAVAAGTHGPARDLARAAAPALCRTLKWGSWKKVLESGKKAAHALGATEDEAYFDREQNSRLKALGKGAAAGAAIGTADVVWWRRFFRHVPGHSITAPKAIIGAKVVLASPVTITTIVVVTVAGGIAGIAAATSGSGALHTPAVNSATAFPPPSFPHGHPTAGSPITFQTPVGHPKTTQPTSPATSATTPQTPAGGATAPQTPAGGPTTTQATSPAADPLVSTAPEPDLTGGMSLQFTNLSWSSGTTTWAIKLVRWPADKCPTRDPCYFGAPWYTLSGGSRYASGAQFILTIKRVGAQLEVTGTDGGWPPNANQTYQGTDTGNLTFAGTFVQNSNPHLTADMVLTSCVTTPTAPDCDLL